MVLIEDTRQQAGKHEKKHDYFDSQGVTVIRSKLPFGDYALAPTVAVDTKASIHEIATNLCGSAAERQRFIRECKSAQGAGCSLIFLVEVGNIKRPADLIGRDVKLLSGKTIRGVQLYRAMITVSERYGCRFEFSPPGKSGARICEILGVGGERLYQTGSEDPRK